VRGANKRARDHKAIASEENVVSWLILSHLKIGIFVLCLQAKNRRLSTAMSTAQRILLNSAAVAAAAAAIAAAEPG
jgi:hypothetical protein